MRIITLKNKIMTQEVQVILTLEVNVTQSKGDIQNFIQELIDIHTRHSSTYNRVTFNFKEDFIIREEAKIYGNE